MAASYPPLENYIPAGSFIIQEANSNVPRELWALPDLQRWRRLALPVYEHQRRDRPNQGPVREPSAHGLPEEIQDLLLKSTAFQPFAGLLYHRWVAMEFMVSSLDPARGIARVYVLPDDVDRRLIDRSNHVLKATRKILLSNLDFSRSAWNGEFGSSHLKTPMLTSEGGDQPAGDASLLEMFNNIPSPDPQTSLVTDAESRDAMWNLLNSNVLGLNTTLYPYQRRSAAIMLQREVQTGEILDPRLVEALDQHGNRWYYDSVKGVGLREPRKYDRVRGGILAEEMGSGKTLICLSLILATRHIPAKAPDLYLDRSPMVRPKVGSLSDMAAACITRNSVPWRHWFDSYETDGVQYAGCIKAILRNPAFYLIPHDPQWGREGRSRHHRANGPIKRVFLSSTSLVIVPQNLLRQWRGEIAKHTSGLRVLVVGENTDVPPVMNLIQNDIILISTARLARIRCDRSLDRHLVSIHFKRLIVDEGHVLGNSKISSRSNLLLVIDELQASARWIVTGTPSKGLFGVDSQSREALSTPDRVAPFTPGSEDTSREGGRCARNPGAFTQLSQKVMDSSAVQEKRDLDRIGSIATLYLKARPWANTVMDGEDVDMTADWDRYVMPRKHTPRGGGREDCLKSTLESLIIRHRLSEIGDLLPPVDETTVFLDGSYQDRLALNLFSMMIVFNSVQSQRTDMDYFFHPRQRKSLLELVSNLRQASFFGGSFYSPEEIRKAVETAEKFLEEGKVPISGEDEALLREAIAFGYLALENKLKDVANMFREVPLYVSNFPGGLGEAWSLDLGQGDPVCTDSRMIIAMQKLVRPCMDAPNSLQVMFGSGRFADAGRANRAKFFEEQLPPSQTNGNGGGGASRTATLAGNTMLGADHNGRKKRKPTTLKRPAHAEGAIIAVPDDDAGTGIAEPLTGTQIISTASAKLSYLVDAVVKYQEEEQIMIFYENDNVAYYLAGVLEILQIHHLIYAKGISAERRAQYVATFNQNPKFRVLLMDISEAAFGLDMRSASRIYFINPVLNPQVEAQAIGRARRINQKRRVTVVTLVLRGSIEEVIVARRGAMTLAEHRKVKSILDDRPIYDWILNARVVPLPEDGGANNSEAEPNGGKDVPGVRETAMLRTPLYIFGRGAGRDAHPDEDLVHMGDEPVLRAAVNSDPGTPSSSAGGLPPAGRGNGETNTAPQPAIKKRKIQFVFESGRSSPTSSSSRLTPIQLANMMLDATIRGEEGLERDQNGAGDEPPARRVRFAGPEEEE